ncbi:glycosyltransferase involved in cell wall biosynthesis [Allocatelliglobosispora scoriae]|uniref:Glycosyltransferase involved in cell wall biosynthesis n=1 Tax=Allocatelliglobosispora scoriae TaxID=643052 RepID=A0A841BP00_9ACTN|nr:glycosyltransferase [Allocatelliglobosispora scoriae]MBB5870807.1 glycosyltransferase involved in cell wall biosynthesis [Allocatelliglobosispora scoriae]
MRQLTDSVAAPAETGLAPLRSVALIIGQLGLGGAEKQVALLALGLHRRGIHTRVITLFSGGPREDDLRAAGVPVHNLGLRRLGRNPADAARLAIGLGRLTAHLRRDRPDVVHSFLYHAYVLATPPARLAGVRVVVAGRRSLGTYLENRRLAQAAQRAVTRRTDLLIANAYAVADDTRRREGLGGDRLAVVYNGLPDAAFAPTTPADLPDPVGPVVVCVANLHDYKGHRHLLDAAALVRTPVTLVLIGDGTERAALAEQADRLGIDLRLLGHASPEEVPAWLARADLVVLPSLTEGMSNAVMEAMAAGRAIVATDVGGTGELLRDRGSLVPPGDPRALAHAIDALLDDPGERLRVGTAARDFAREHLTAEAMVRRHIEIYRELVAAKCAG